MGYAKGKSSPILFERYANMKYKCGSRKFRCCGHYVNTIGNNAKKTGEYIRNNLKEDLEYDKMTLEENTEPFTGEPVEWGK